MSGCAIEKIIKKAKTEFPASKLGENEVTHCDDCEQDFVPQAIKGEQEQMILNIRPIGEELGEPNACKTLLSGAQIKVDQRTVFTAANVANKQ